MPVRNGTGPDGRGVGRGLGRGLKPGKGPGGNCICPECGTKVPHQPGTPCTVIKCPDCGNKMTRE